MNRKVVMHACGQDMEILEQYFMAKPYCLFDTQIAARFLGMPSFPSYGSLVAKYLGAAVDKTMQFCDWSKRPLNKEQIEYAKLDVLYLNQLYPIIASELQQSEKEIWFREDMQSIINTPTFDLKTATTKLLYKFLPQLHNIEEAYLGYALIAARERTAVAFDVARPMVLHNTHIMSSVKLKRLSMAKARINNIHKKYFAAALEEIVSEQGTWSNLVEKIWNEVTSMRLNKNGQYATAKALLIHTSQQLNVSTDLIASSEDILKTLSGGESKINQGWRYDCFGSKLLA
jgi:ribonuclease D